MSKTLNTTIEFVLYDISYQNAMMYSRANPLPYDKPDEGSVLFDKSKDQNDPAVFSQTTEEDLKPVTIWSHRI